jgi:hypothetical protein
MGAADLQTFEVIAGNCLREFGYDCQGTSHGRLRSRAPAGRRRGSSPASVRAEVQSGSRQVPK